MDNHIGAAWLIEQVEGMTDSIKHISPSQYNESVRYLPESVTSRPGYMDLSYTPTWREILDCFDIESPVREVNVKKGVQVAYTTILESIFLYFMGHVKTVPCMYITADKELANARVENNFTPMINQSGLAHLIRSSDEGNRRKSGKTVNHIQWEGGGYMVPFGAQNANKMRSFSIMVMLKDEISGWPKVVGRDGNPHLLTDSRCTGYWENRKIFRGSTPLLSPNDPIDVEYLRGDQRKYMVRCQGRCNLQHEIRWSGVNKQTGHEYGIKWETEDDSLIIESVRYICPECGREHYEAEKEYLLSAAAGAMWVPTARPENPFIRSYHHPAMISTVSPWHKQVTDYIAGWDVKNKKVRDIGKYQTFYNNVLAEAFENTGGGKVKFTTASSHRRRVYRLGQVPNQYAAQYSRSPILFLTCHVDVHGKNLAVSVMGWCREAICYVIDYWRFEGDDCTQISDPVWQRLREVIENKTYTADNGWQYRVAFTTVDCGYSNDTVITFCAEYAANVYPIIGAERPAKAARIKEFSEFTTANGILGYRIIVDHYKDRNGPVLRRDWSEDAGQQDSYHFNAPIDIPDKAITELTAEYRREVVDARGNSSYQWHRPGGAPNELWDLFVYGSATVEIIAMKICTEQLGLESVDWPRFWEFCEKTELFCVRTIDGTVNKA